NVPVHPVADHGERVFGVDAVVARIRELSIYLLPDFSARRALSEESGNFLSDAREKFLGAAKLRVFAERSGEAHFAHVTAMDRSHIQDVDFTGQQAARARGKLGVVLYPVKAGALAEPHEGVVKKRSDPAIAQIFVEQRSGLLFRPALAQKGSDVRDRI